MKTKSLTKALERIENWPAQWQDQLAEIAFDIDSSLKDGVYHPSREELEGIDIARCRAEPVCHGRRGRGGLRQIPRQMKVVFTAAARNDLRDIGEWLTLHYPAVAPHVERRIRNIVARVGR